MTQPTKAQWDEVAKQLDSLFTQTYLRCDGFLVSAGMQRDKNKLVIVVYVNGYIRGKWFGLFDSIDELSEEARRFWMPRKRQKETAKQLKLSEKIWGKRECRKRGYYDPWIQPTPHWNSANSFIRHLKKHNEQIEILTYEEYEAASAEQKAKEAANA